MKFRILIVIVSFVSVFSIRQMLATEMTYAWVGCDGTVVSRTDVGRIQVFYTDHNLAGCQGPKWVDPSLVVATPVIMTGSTTATGLTSTGATSTGVTFTGSTLSGFTMDQWTDGESQSVDAPLLDLAQTDIVAYRIELMRAQQIQYANALRSVRMRNAATKKSKTNAYLMQDDALVVTGSGNGWTPVQGATVSVTDTIENTVTADITGQADGYIATRFLRDPNSSDLVRIEQADQQFWSDIAHVNVDHTVNVRLHPWYTAPIVTVLRNNVPLYVVSTVDNWSEVISDDRTLHGYIRSDYLTITKHQRVEVAPLLK
jgi:hypothetical protein